MFDNKTKIVKNRIVSISKPYVRPIKRGKASAPVEFGPKITVGLVNGYAHIFDLSWNNINEGTLLIPMIKDYYKKFGFYPEAVLVDKLFRTKKNIKFCEKYNIRISGKALGRPKIEPKTKEQMKIEIQDEKDRNAIEGIFGVAKRRFNLNLIMSKLQTTSETAVALSILLVNLEKRMRDIFVRFIFTPLFRVFSKLFFVINKMVLI